LSDVFTTQACCRGDGVVMIMALSSFTHPPTAPKIS
jgi:hypothetical protein